MKTDDTPNPPRPGRQLSQPPFVADLRDRIRRANRRYRVRQRIGDLKARVRDLGRQQRRTLDAQRRGPGFTWRGWWYPRALVLGLLWLAILGLLAVLVAALHSHPVLGA